MFQWIQRNSMHSLNQVNDMPGGLGEHQEKVLAYPCSCAMVLSRSRSWGSGRRPVRMQWQTWSSFLIEEYGFRLGPAIGFDLLDGGCVR